MSLIRLSMIAGAALYIGLFIAQGAFTILIIYAAIIGSLILIGLASRLFVSNEEQAKKYEMILIWCSLLTFAIYGLLFAGGVI